ncbi:MAG: rod shape-determining protein RodA [Proteobacteria bacterium]|nr:rod shape-determining protein RodA [Pseudomonadota bacterium]
MLRQVKTNKLFWEGIFIISVIIIIGCINLYSALYSQTGRIDILFYKHLIWLVVGIFLSFLFQQLKPVDIENFSSIFYIISCALLVVVLLIGKKVNGAQRWLGFGSFSFQPSEFAKLALIFFMAKLFKQMPVVETGYRLNQLFVPLLIVMIPVVLVLKQPDLGTAIIIFSITFFMILLMGINKRLLMTSITGFVLLSPILYHFLKDYQKKRFLAFLSPESDPLGIGYHTIQAKIAVSTGGLMGKGFLKGTQSKLGYIPEKHTDFVFSVFSEEWGFVGVVFFILAYVYLIYWMFRVTKGINDRFLFLSASGIIFLFSLHFLINLAMVGGLFPVVGIPLPLMSYGGSALIIYLIAIGFMLKQSLQ